MRLGRRRPRSAMGCELNIPCPNTPRNDTVQVAHPILTRGLLMSGWLVQVVQMDSPGNPMRMPLGMPCLENALIMGRPRFLHGVCVELLVLYYLLLMGED